MGTLAAIGQFFRAIAEGLGLAKARSDAKNTADQRANAEAAQIQADRDQARKDIASGDPEALEKDLS